MLLINDISDLALLLVKRTRFWTCKQNLNLFGTIFGMCSQLGPIPKLGTTPVRLIFFYLIRYWLVFFSIWFWHLFLRFEQQKINYPVYFIDITIWQQDKICKNDIPEYRVFFLTHPFSRMAPPKCFDWPLPKLSKCWNHIHFARHLGVFRSEGGPVWDSNVFFNWLGKLSKTT